MAALEIDILNPAIALVAATAKTVLQIIAASTTKVKVGGIGESLKRFIEVSFDGVSATDQPVLVKILRQTTAIGGTPTTVTPVKHINGTDGTVQTTAKTYGGSPTEPTGSDVYWAGYLHPQGRHVIPWTGVIEQSDRLGIVCTAPAAVNVTVTVPCEE